LLGVHHHYDGITLINSARKYTVMINYY